MGKTVILENLGRIRYKEAWDYQEKLFEQVIREKLDQKADKHQYLLFVNTSMYTPLGKVVTDEIF